MEQPDQNQAIVSLLVDRSKAGDTSAFGALMTMHQGYAYSIAFRILRSEDQAKDVVQEAFVRIWKHVARYHETAKFTTWLYTIVVRLCYDRMKSEKRRWNLFAREERASQEHEPVSRSLESEVEGRDTVDRILALAKELPPKQRLVFMLRDLQDWTIGEISEMTRMSVGTVKANLCLARKALREAYNELEG